MHSWKQLLCDLVSSVTWVCAELCSRHTFWPELLMQPKLNRHALISIETTLQLLLSQLLSRHLRKTRLACLELATFNRCKSWQLTSTEPKQQRTMHALQVLVASPCCSACSAAAECPTTALQVWWQRTTKQTQQLPGCQAIKYYDEFIQLPRCALHCACQVMTAG